MGFEAWIAVIGSVGTLLLVLVGVLNFFIFSKQLAVAREQISTAVRQLELAQKAPDLHLIQRSIAETSDHIRILVDKPHLRRYFYDEVQWKEGDTATLDEVKLVSELLLNNFVSSLMHSATFPQYPVRGIDRIISYHLRRSPALCQFLAENFERFPFTGLTLLCLKARARDEVIADLQGLAGAPGLDQQEAARRSALLRLYTESPPRDPIEFTALNMEKRQ
jgi:hypothetical protein